MSVSPEKFPSKIHTFVTTLPTSDVTAYIERVRKNRLAIRVKLNDLRNNMDISRIPQPPSKDLERLERNEAEYAELMEWLSELINKQKENIE